MEIKYVHVLVDRDGTVKPVNHPQGIGAKKYATMNGFYHIVQNKDQDDASSIVFPYGEDKYVDLSIFLQEEL